mmetsp:Transcript_45736/g.129547  ORF Transcript_45736/g.129547 Transcript_45736/m.129547 type:complete len:90 (-) Transcript_45736:199-468(-)
MAACDRALRSLIVLLVLASSAVVVDSGPLSYGICQTGCNALVVSCYAAAGFTFGTVTAGASTPFVIITCNAGLGTCMVACIAAGFTPTP